MSSAPDLPPAPQRLAVDYIHAPGPQALLGMSETLAVLGFGALAPSSAAIDDPRYLHVPLSPLREAAAPYEVWRSAGPVATGREGAIRYSHDGALMFGVLEWEEPDGGILHASAHAYAALVAFWRDSDYPHLLRIWNYFDAITLGEGDSASAPHAQTPPQAADPGDLSGPPSSDPAVLFSGLATLLSEHRQRDIDAPLLGGTRSISSFAPRDATRTYSANELLDALNRLQQQSANDLSQRLPPTGGAVHARKPETEPAGAHGVSNRPLGGQQPGIGTV